MAESLRTFSKQERICGVRSISRLLDGGRYGSEKMFRYCFISADGPESRIMVSVPKKKFRRAVKRNLLKRRIREAYRLQKGLLAGRPADVLFIYGSREPASYGEIFTAVGNILRKVGRAVSSKPSAAKPRTEYGDPKAQIRDDNPEVTESE